MGLFHTKMAEMNQCDRNRKATELPILSDPLLKRCIVEGRLDRSVRGLQPKEESGDLLRGRCTEASKAGAREGAAGEMGLELRP